MAWFKNRKTGLAWYVSSDTLPSTLAERLQNDPNYEVVDAPNSPSTANAQAEAPQKARNRKVKRGTSKSK